MSTSSPESSSPRMTYDDVVWDPSYVILADKQLLARHKGALAVIMENCVPSAELASHGYAVLPESYDLYGVTVRFIPHYAKYNVGELRFSPPPTREVLLADVAMHLRREAVRATCKEQVDPPRKEYHASLQDPQLRSVYYAARDAANASWQEVEAELAAYTTARTASIETHYLQAES